MAEEKDVEQQSEEKVKSGKFFLKFIILGIAVVVLGGGGFAGWSLFVKNNGKQVPMSEAPSQTKKRETRIAFPLKSFIVNLKDKSGLGKRYLKVTMVLELEGQGSEQVVEQRKPELKDTILLLLSSQFFDDISTVEGKLELKQALVSRINQALGNSLVRKIYFTEFVVQ
ncbi:MAG: flagellar basal body-associated FliL family protein [Thermodesulfobacteriota bacterium]